VSASSRINSSTMFSDSGGADVCTTNSPPRDVLLDPDLEVLVREARGGKPAGRDAETLADRLGQRGCDDPEKTLRPSISAAPYCSPFMDGSSGAR